jgi:hypothetical protein
MTPFGQEIKNGDGSGEAASVRQLDGVDEQISTLLESLEVESETELPRPASRPPNSKPTSPGPVLHHQAAAYPPVSPGLVDTWTLHERAATCPRRRRRRAIERRLRRLLPFIIAGLLGIGVGWGTVLLLGS